MNEPSVSDDDRRRPRVTAVVLNWCREPLTRRAVASLQESAYAALDILIVDNGSPDGSGERLREAFPRLGFLQTGTNLGYAGGNNRGIEHALEHGSDFVLLLNDDAVVEPDTVSHLVQTARRHPGAVGCVVPKILYYDEPERIWFGGGRFSPMLGLGIHEAHGQMDGPSMSEPAREVTFATGCCCLLSAEALRAVGGFDEAFFAYVEDAELCLRLLGGGYAVVYEPRARVLHDQPPAGGEPTPFHIRQRDRNRRRVMRLHFPWYRRLPFLVRFYVTRVVLLARYLVKADFERARAVVRGSWDGGR